MEFEYDPEEIVLCYHGKLMYEAKCLKTDVREVNGTRQPAYLVHYHGWNKKWDEWVASERMMKRTEANIAFMERLAQETMEMEKEKRKKKPGKSDSSPPAEDSAEENGHTVKRPKAQAAASGELRMPIPSVLRDQLANDWHAIVNDKRLVPLPRTPSISRVLAEFRRRGCSKQRGEHVKAVVAGLKAQFCVGIGQSLLYAFERAQYAETLQKYSVEKLTDVYGAEHLLRLLVQMPVLLTHAQVTDNTLAIQVQIMLDLLEYMRKHREKLFVTEYDNATPAYIRMSIR
eukprot:m.5382 g.5382  ORF g.5382 m.5382 type:complete len:287 (+) comp3527_c0_seq1:114-974(+)